MTLIAILLALAAEHLLGRKAGWGSGRLATLYVAAWRSLLSATPLWRSWLVVPLLILPPSWVVYVLFERVDNLFVALVASAGVLLLCLSPRALVVDIQALLAAREQGDAETAARLARALQRGPEPDADHRSLIGALFIQSHERLFGPLLWFFALGPAGAVLYRLASRLPYCLHEDGDCAALRGADIVHGLVAWIPVRLTSLLFGLAGSLDDALHAWTMLRGGAAPGWRGRTWALLAETGIGAVETDAPGGGPMLPPTLDEAAQEVLNLQSRALLVLLACFALFATGSWIA